MKRIIICTLIVSLLFTGCGTGRRGAEPTQYSATYLTLFDTVTTVTGRADSESEFHSLAQAIHDNLLEYHQLFDIYHTYHGVTNLKNINDAAGTEPVKVDERIIALLLDCKNYYTLTNGKVNIAMGSVLSLWHEARNAGIHDPASAKLPDANALKEAACHTDLDCVIIDEDASTVYISDPSVMLDVGAVAKGWAAQRVAEISPDGLLISVGGNVCVTGPKDPTGTPWIVGIQNPDGDGYLHTVSITGGSVVTSGDYQRVYTVDGAAYHHIIDPETLFPSTLWRSVTVICDDSGMADALSTALFLLPQDIGQGILDQCGAQAMWTSKDGTICYSPGFEELIRS